MTPQHYLLIGLGIIWFIVSALTPRSKRGITNIVGMIIFFAAVYWSVGSRFTQ